MKSRAASSLPSGVVRLCSNSDILGTLEANVLTSRTSFSTSFSIVQLVISKLTQKKRKEKKGLENFLLRSVHTATPAIKDFVTFFAEYM